MTAQAGLSPNPPGNADGESASARPLLRDRGEARHASDKDGILSIDPIAPGGSSAPRAKVPETRREAALHEVFGFYHVVHAIPGRLRLRPLGVSAAPRPPASLASRTAMFEAAFPGAAISIGERTGSVLVLLPGKLLQSGAPGVELAGQVTNPIPGKLRSFFYPRAFVAAAAVLRAVPYIFTALKALLRGCLGLDVLDGAALLVCLLRRDFRSLSSITFFFALGEYLADWTRKKSRTRLEESLALNIDRVWVRVDDLERSVPLAEVRPGDEVVVRTGAVVPVDGTVIDGQGLVNQASMTGESLPVPRSAGASVYAGTVLVEGEIVIRTGRVGANTRIQGIIRSIEESESVKASIQGRYERIADAIVPYNFLLSGAVYAATRSLIRAGSVLLVDYSCAIRLATPLSIFTAMREAAERGVLIKGGKFMEAISDADVVIFDKTGTLTKAKPAVVGVLPFGGRKRSTVLRLAACLEEHFAHPVGQAVVRASDAEDLKHREEHSKVEFIVAHGIASEWRGKRVLIGSDHFVLEDESIPVTDEQRAIIAEESSKGRSLLYLSIGGELAGILLIEDEIRAETPAVIAALRADGVKRVIMLTGDSERTAKSIAERAGIDEYVARLLPAGKAEYVMRLKREGWRVAMVGDGVNDSPALSAAHVGIAMAEGADIAREVADIVLLNGELAGLLMARDVSRQALQRVRTGFHVSLFWNSLFLVGGLMGVLRPGLSALLHNATTAAIAVSSLRPFPSPYQAP